MEVKGYWLCGMSINGYECECKCVWIGIEMKG